ncbi:MAG: exosome complex RNA-binding protein Csl4 [Zestosphaera sp.]
MRLDELNKLRLVPGEEVCVLEEFLPGNGTYEHEGIVRSTIVGRPLIDLDIRVVEVRPSSNRVYMPTAGSIVYGIVSLVKDEYALARIYCDAKCRKYLTTFTGILYVSQISDMYVRSVYELVRPGDVVKAKSLSDTPPYRLTLKERQLGVVLAYCSVCGAKLVKHGNTLSCPACKSSENRKTAPEYNNIKCT